MGTALIRRRVDILYQGTFLTSVAVGVPVSIVDSHFIAEALREALHLGVFQGLHAPAVTFSVVHDDVASD